MRTELRIVLVVVALIFINDVHAQKRELRSIIDTVIMKAKNTALRTRDINWDSVEAEMLKKAKYGKTVADLRGSFETMLVALDDRHGLFYNPRTKAGVAGYPEYLDPEIPTSDKSSRKSAENLEFRILPNNVRYLKLVACPYGKDINKQAELIRKAVDSLSNDDASMWIVDLRYVSGGDMHPLIAGVSPLLGEGLIATCIDGNKKIRNLYAVHNGRFYDNQSQVVKLPAAVRDLRTSKIAVLTSGYTSGSGEVLAIMFRGRKNTKFFGERTAGNVTRTGYESITEDLVMSISELKYHDRKGNGYFESFKPDAFVMFESGTPFEKDRAIADANFWLNSTADVHGTNVASK